MSGNTTEVHCGRSASYGGDLGYFGPDVHDVFLQQFLLVGDLLSVGRLLPVLLHLLVGNIQHRLQLVLDTDAADGVTTHAGRSKQVGNITEHTDKRPCRPLRSVFWPRAPAVSCLVRTVGSVSPEEEKNMKTGLASKLTRLFAPTRSAERAEAAEAQYLLHRQPIISFLSSFIPTVQPDKKN